MSKEILIYGAGGAGRELVFFLSLDKNPDTSWKITGFIDDNSKLHGQVVNGIPVVGGIDYLKDYSGNVAVAIVNNPREKRSVVSKIKENKSIKFPVIVAPTAIVAPSAKFGEGCVISGTHATISIDVTLGEFVFVNSRTGIGHDAKIFDYSSIFAGISIGGSAVIGSDCIIGSGATILPNVRIGNCSIIGGGAVVSRNVPPSVVAAGVPAKIMREIK